MAWQSCKRDINPAVVVCAHGIGGRHERAVHLLLDDGDSAWHGHHIHPRHIAKHIHHMRLECGQIDGVSQCDALPA